MTSATTRLRRRCWAAGGNFSWTTARPPGRGVGRQAYRAGVWRFPVPRRWRCGVPGQVVLPSAIGVELVPAGHDGDEDQQEKSKRPRSMRPRVDGDDAVAPDQRRYSASWSTNPVTHSRRRRRGGGVALPEGGEVRSSSAVPADAAALSRWMESTLAARWRSVRRRPHSSRDAAARRTAASSPFLAAAGQGPRSRGWGLAAADEDCTCSRRCGRGAGRRRRCRRWGGRGVFAAHPLFLGVLGFAVPGFARRRVWHPRVGICGFVGIFSLVASGWAASGWAAGGLSASGLASGSGSSGFEFVEGGTKDFSFQEPTW